MCVFVCVRERETERESQREKDRDREREREKCLTLRVWGETALIRVQQVMPDECGSLPHTAFPGIPVLCNLHALEVNE